MPSIFQPVQSLPHILSKSVRRDFLFTVFNGAILSVLVIALVCVIVGTYVGAYYNPYQYTTNLQVVIINKDNGVFGNFIQKGLLSNSLLGWQVNANLSDPVQYLSDYYAWAAVIIPSNFTSILNSSLLKGGTYKNEPLQVISEQGRNYSGQRFCIGVLNATLTAISVSLQQFLLSNYSQYIGSADPNVMAQTIPLTYITLHPVRFFGENVASAFAVIMICSLSLSSMLNNLRVYTTLFPKVNIHQIFWWRVLHSYINTLLLSLGICLTVICYGSDITKGFMAYWMFTWLFTSTMAAIVSLFTQLFGVYTSIAFPMFLLLSYSGAGAGFPLELSPPFYHYGVVLPLYHVIRGNRYVLFGTGEIALSVGVLFIYMVISISCSYVLYIQNMYKVEKMKIIQANKMADAKMAQCEILELANLPTKRVNGNDAAHSPGVHENFTNLPSAS
jgi:uncharacterized phage infection (PIP) family protein YhgE